MPDFQERTATVNANANVNANVNANGNVDANANANVNVSSEGMDASEHFMISLAPALKRLGPRKQAMVRIKFQQILFDMEFGKE